MAYESTHGENIAEGISSHVAASSSNPTTHGISTDKLNENGFRWTDIHLFPCCRRHLLIMVLMLPVLSIPCLPAPVTLDIVHTVRPHVAHLQENLVSMMSKTIEHDNISCEMSSDEKVDLYCRPMRGGFKLYT